MSDGTLQEKAARNGISRQAAANIQKGKSYRDVLPHLLRKTTHLRCDSCVFFDGYKPNPKQTTNFSPQCNLGIPDVKSPLGAYFANECNYYIAANEIDQASA
jgi:hypothetical protein